MIPVELIVNIVVAGAFLFFWILTFIILYHLSRFGIGTLPKRFAGIFLAGAVLLTSVNIILFASLDLSSILTRI